MPGKLAATLLATEALLPFEEALVRLFGPPIDEATVLVVLTAGLVYPINSRYTGGEDGADSGGIAQAYDAWQARRNVTPAHTR
jgi:hypothetical protein